MDAGQKIIVIIVLVLVIGLFIDYFSTRGIITGQPLRKIGNDECSTRSCLPPWYCGINGCSYGDQVCPDGRLCPEHQYCDESNQCKSYECSFDSDCEKLGSTQAVCCINNLCAPCPIDEYEKPIVKKDIGTL